MNVQLRWTDADVASAHWAYLRHNPLPFIRYFRYSIVAVVVSGTILIQYPESWKVVGWLIFLDAGTIAYQLFLSRRSTNLRFKNSRLWQDTVSVIIEGNSIRMTGPSFDKTVEWSEFSEIFESKSIFIFGTGRKKILFLPKSGMSESQIEELRTLISTYAKGKVHLARPK
jgi:hypothetical protein